MKRKFSKEISVSTENEQCEKLLVFKYRTENNIDGVKFLAWHIVDNKDETEEHFIQEEFIPMPSEMIEDYIRDFTGVSAQNFVDRFDI